MRTALSTSSVAFRPEVFSRTYCRKDLQHHGCTLLRRRSPQRWRPIVCSMETPAAGHFGDESNRLATYVNNTVHSLWNTSCEPLKEFPWQKARFMATERLATVSQKALKLSLIVVFAIGFPYDVILAISANRELIIPLGLFVGVIVADLLKESFKEFFENRVKDELLVLGVGLFFMAVKFLSLCLKVRGMLLLSHFGNGGLMQVLWWLKGHQSMHNNHG